MLYISAYCHVSTVPNTTPSCIVKTRPYLNVTMTYITHISILLYGHCPGLHTTAHCQNSTTPECNNGMLYISAYCYMGTVPDSTPSRIVKTPPHLNVTIFTFPVFSATMNRNFLQPFFHETVPVTFEPTAMAAVLNTALSCIKNDYFKAKTGQF